MARLVQWVVGKIAKMNEIGKDFVFSGKALYIVIVELHINLNVPLAL